MPDLTKIELASSDSIGSSKGRWWLYALTVLLAVAHGGQSILFFNAIPGDLGDARLGNCILEHFYQVLCGHGHLFSPAQFYPVEGTLVYSDNHFGTALFYAATRVLGASMESAFQVWILAMIAADAAALLFVLRRLRVNPWIASPLAFFGSSSFALVFKTEHPQVLPFFPFLLALSLFITFLRSADARSLGYAAAWVAYQNACYMYHGYFTVLIFGSLFALFICFGSGYVWFRTVAQSIRVNLRFLVVFFALAGVSLGFLYYPYARFSTQTGTRAMDELVALSPNFGAWFSASPFSVFYQQQNFYKPGSNSAENTLFAGWLIWGVLGAALLAGMRSARNSNLRLASLLAGTCLVLIAALTSWREPHGSAYLWIAEHVVSVRAFRSFSRINYLLIAVEAIAAALLLNHYFQAAKSRIARIVAVVIAGSVAAEGLAIGQVHYLKSVAQERGAALSEMWRRCGNRKVLVFAPGYSNQAPEAINTDAWQAALMLHRRTLNGYSGNYPRGYGEFLNFPTSENAEALLAELQVSKEEVSLVTDWLPETKTRLGIQSYQFLPLIVPLSSITEVRLAPMEEKLLPAILESAQVADLDCDAAHVYASYRLFDAQGMSVDDPPSPRTAVHRIAAGASLPVGVRIQAPARRGIYEIRLSMVQEGVAWWADLGHPGSTVKMVVE